MKIGVDLGNVIIGGDTEGGTNLFFTNRFLETPEVLGSYESMKPLRLNHEIHFISKCSEPIELKSIDWLDEHGYVNLTKGRTHFVRRRELKVLMAQALQLDIFIDDRIEIIQSMKDIIKYPIQFESWGQVNAELEKIFRIESLSDPDNRELG